MANSYAIATKPMTEFFVLNFSCFDEGIFEDFCVSQSDRVWDERFPKGVCIKFAGTDSPNLDGLRGRRLKWTTTQ